MAAREQVLYNETYTLDRPSHLLMGTLRMLRTFLYLLPFTLLVPAVQAAGDDAAGVEFFEKKVRPALTEHCYSCHSTAAGKQRGGLLLDTRAGVLQGGDSGPALVAGQPDKSLLLQAVRYTGDLKMPPKSKLPETVVADLETWIKLGAPDPRAAATATAKQVGLSVAEGRTFWAYQPPRLPAVPTVQVQRWPANAIDAFILTRIEARGLLPAADAEPGVLLRRLYFDLVGLPPTPAEVTAFEEAALRHPQSALEETVDRLLASPHFGERWGRHWLDVARYAESLTLRGFIMKEAWRYRDYVIDSFNADAPYDQFLRAQVAGDLLSGDSPAEKRRQLIATTFLTLGNTNLEEQDKKQLRMDVVDEQLDTLGRAFLAQTIGCARCHDHKFDPIPTKDYYALAGILRNTRTLEHANVSKWLEMPLPPMDLAQEKQLQQHEAAVAALQRQIQSLKSATAKAAKPTKPTAKKAVAVASLPGIVVDDTQAKKIGEWKDSTTSGSYVGAGYLHDLNTGKGEKTLTFQPELPHSGKYEVRFSYSPGTGRAAAVPVTVFSADGEKMLTIDQREPPSLDGLFVSLGQYNFERTGQSFVIVSTEDTKGHVTADAVVFIPVEKLAATTANAPETAKPTGKTASGGDADTLGRLEAEMKRLTANGPRREMVMSVKEEPQIENTRVHIRGSVHNLGEETPRGFLQVASAGAPPTFPTGASGRRELADWLASRDNPLTARVFVNRAWHWLFGTGLVRTTDNFGVTGEKPSHPELLDFLALRFMEEGWSIKQLVRELVLSRTYRQSVAAADHVRAADPENRLFARANRRRLDAECLHDTILSVSGRLTLDVGGPTYATPPGSDYNFKHTDTRRGVYAAIYRNALPELFEVFDYPDPSVSTGRRNVSTVAPQALYLMNNPFVLEQSRHAAQRLLSEPDLEDSARIARAYRLTLGRAPTGAELRLAETFLAETGPSGAERPEAWARLFQTLFASIDFRFVN